MSYCIKMLEKSYQPQLLALAKSQNTGSELFNTDRGNDFFALSEELGDSRYFGILKNEELLGMIGIARQLRFIKGQAEPAYYIFDLKVHPGSSGKPIYYRLLQHVVAHYREVEKAAWVFATILDSNQKLRPLTRGARHIPEGIFMGKNYHVGFPLFLPQKSSEPINEVKEIAAEQAWAFYAEQARHKEFAPADKLIFFRRNGFYLGCFRNGKLVATAKVMDQSHARNIILTQPQPFSFRLLNLLCRFYNCPPLPRQNQVFHHGYLGYFAANQAGDFRKDFMHYIQKEHPGKFTYVFTGMTENEAKDYKGRLLIKFSSSNYGYGKMPVSRAPEAVELTLI